MIKLSRCSASPLGGGAPVSTCDTPITTPIAVEVLGLVLSTIQAIHPRQSPLTPLSIHIATSHPPRRLRNGAIAEHSNARRALINHADQQPSQTVVNFLAFTLSALLERQEEEAKHEAHNVSIRSPAANLISKIDWPPNITSDP